MSTLFQILGGLALFIYGMKMLSESLEQATGDKLRKILASITSNRFFGIVTGTFVTAVLQSSAAVIVMVISFVNAGMLNMFQGISIILGANIGTTITGWIVNLTNAKFGFDIMILANLAAITGLICIFSKRKKVTLIGMCLIGFGLLFIGLEMMQTSVPVLDPASGKKNFVYDMLNFLSGFGTNSKVASYFCLYLFILIGFVATVALQSSSVTLAITITLLGSGYMDMYAACAMVIGENIGSTVTAVLASLAGNKTAKKTAAAHVTLKVFGAIWLILPFIFYPFCNICSFIIPGDGMEGLRLALFHTIFNIVNTFIMAWFIKPLIRLMDRIFGTDEKQEETFGLIPTNLGLIRTPDSALFEVRNEITKMADFTIESFDSVVTILTKHKGNNDKFVERIFEIEDIVDKYEKNLYTFLIQVLGETNQGKTIERINSMIEEIRNYEWISDSCEKIAKLYRKSKENDYDLESLDVNIEKILGEATNLVNIVRYNIANLKDRSLFEKTMEIEDKINSLYKKNKKKVVVDMKKNSSKDIVSSGICLLDMIRELEHIADDILNIIKIHNTQQI